MIDYTGIPDALNERIKFIRKKHGYNQGDIADKLNVSRVTYTKYEIGNRAIPTEVVMGLSLIYSISTDFILGLSAKPQYVDYSNYATGLSYEATKNLQDMHDRFKMCFSAVNKLLESKYVYRIFHFLSFLIKIPKNYDELLMENEEDMLTYGSLLAFQEDFMIDAKLPKGIFGTTDRDLWMMDDMHIPEVFETYLRVFLNRFIDEIRESPETKKSFIDDIKKTYQECVQKDIEELENE